MHNELLDWDPSNPENFIGEMEGSMDKASLYGRLGASNHDAFILTAGYKGVLLSLAVQLARFSHERFSKIFYLHETSRNIIPISIYKGIAVTSLSQNDLPSV